MKGKHGGKRENAGRNSKAEEQKLIEKLSPLEDLAFTKLKECINDNQGWAIKMYFEYMYGKPKETVNNTHEIVDITKKPIEFVSSDK